jgi:hypothetical protein
VDAPVVDAPVVDAAGADTAIADEPIADIANDAELAASENPLRMREKKRKRVVDPAAVAAVRRPGKPNRTDVIPDRVRNPSGASRRLAPGTPSVTSLWLRIRERLFGSAAVRAATPKATANAAHRPHRAWRAAHAR